MDRYIDADALAVQIRDNVFHDFTDEFWGVMQCIGEAPTEDVAPVVHAHWETDNYGYAILNEDGGTLYLAGVPCSRCHVTGHTNWNYCPNCGAKMDEVVNDDQL